MNLKNIAVLAMTLVSLTACKVDINEPEENGTLKLITVLFT